MDDGIVLRSRDDIETALGRPLDRSESFFLCWMADEYEVTVVARTARGAAEAYAAHMAQDTAPSDFDDTVFVKKDGGGNDTLSFDVTVEWEPSASARGGKAAVNPPPPLPRPEKKRSPTPKTKKKNVSTKQHGSNSGGPRTAGVNYTGLTRK